MYQTVKKTSRFSLDSTEDMGKYDDIINNPLCTIIDEWREKKRQSEYTEEGKLASQTDEWFLCITYQEKKLL